MVMINDINITPLIRARTFLQNSLQQTKSRLEIAGTIQAFKSCYELAWDTLKRLLAYRDIDVAHPMKPLYPAVRLLN